MTHNQIAYYNAKLQEGANLETARSNRIKEAISDFEAKSQDRYRRGSLAINELQQQEAMRHNVASEALQARLNEIQDLHNRRISEIQQRQAEIQARQVDYQYKYNTGLLLGQSEQRKETERHNREVEAETKSYNQAQVGLQNVRNFWTGFGAIAQIPAIVLGTALTYKKVRG
jgi:hypothetical protein